MLLASRPSSHLRRRRGFTLLEVLATIALIAIVLPVAMYGVSLCIQGSENAKQLAEASTLAQGKLAELASSTDLLTSAASSGDFSPDFPQYTWKSTVIDQDMGLEEINLEVDWTTRGKDRHLNVSTWVFNTSTAQ